MAKALIERAGSISPVVAKMIMMLAERDRLMLLPEIARGYRERLMDHQKIVRGEVTTAVALPPETLRSLEQGLQQATGRKVRARSESRSVDYRRRGHAAGQHGLRRQRDDTVAENETVAD